MSFFQSLLETQETVQQQPITLPVPRYPNPEPLFANMIPIESRPVHSIDDFNRSSDNTFSPVKNPGSHEYGERTDLALPSSSNQNTSVYPPRQLISFVSSIS